MVVLALRPTAEIPINGATFATTRTIAAATVRASVRSSESGLLEAIVWLQRGQRALPPDIMAGMRCNRSHSGQATRFSVRDTMASLLSDIKTLCREDDPTAGGTRRRRQTPPAHRPPSG